MLLVHHHFLLVQNVGNVGAYVTQVVVVFVDRNIGVHFVDIDHAEPILFDALLHLLKHLFVVLVDFLNISLRTGVFLL